MQDVPYVNPPSAQAGQLLGKVLIVDDDPLVCQTLEWRLTRLGLQVRSLTDAQETVSFCDEWRPHVLVSDIHMPMCSGFDILKKLRERHIWMPVIFITGYDDVPLTIRASREGAFDCLEKPIDWNRLHRSLQKALDYMRASEEAESMPCDPLHIQNDIALIGKTHVMDEVYRQIGLVTGNRVTVLIQGESGTGKECAARVIHQSGVTAGKPFVALNCSAVPEGLFESELFGHVRGSFTGAHRDRRGRVEMAGDGTLFLDEVSDIPLSLQAKLLRLLQERSYEMVGSEECRTMRARIIAATNTKLEEAVADGRFREDLYYRLNIMRIDMPPLRERLEDIPRLVLSFLRKYNVEFGRNIVKLPYTVIDVLAAHDWPGNVRELESVVLQAVLRSKGDVLNPSDFRPQIHTERRSDEGIPDNLSLADVEKMHIDRVLRACQWNKQAACAILGISKPTLYHKIQIYHLFDTAKT
ncbi:MAG: sigma-54-dependent Fis family transcriptional regulator [Ignavibacteriae bacterium]|nr:sigma-54-dependent Fis family transcriptional regulator [Ignavibacteriota bacterium]